MNETPMLFPIEPNAFWQQMKKLIEEAVSEKAQKQSLQKEEHLPQKPLFKLSDLCFIFQVSKPTIYEWINDGKLRSFKIRNRRYFTREDVEAVIKGRHLPPSPFFPSDNPKS